MLHTYSYRMLPPTAGDARGDGTVGGSQRCLSRCSIRLLEFKGIVKRLVDYIGCKAYYKEG